ncbi:hypothetical protein BDN71DRAFT_648800 [Pleurotus eryngii]|uniref:Uncharacterized protein n=1 Tax=Pleurotus eryngii TaxID=5323 RepID=A0A9P6D960_PLEER|nr:hypothetical protein BDN71DRAFT_648800 [Pleurotus eryngii]
MIIGRATPVPSLAVPHAPWCRFSGPNTSQKPRGQPMNPPVQTSLSVPGLILALFLTATTQPVIHPLIHQVAAPRQYSLFPDVPTAAETNCSRRRGYIVLSLSYEEAFWHFDSSL